MKDYGFVIGMFVGILVMASVCFFILFKAESSINEVRDTCIEQIKPLKQPPKGKE